MRLNRRHRRLFLVLGICIALLAAAHVIFAAKNDLAAQKARAEETTRAYAEELQTDMEYGIDIVNSLNTMAVEKKVNTENFALAAELMMRGTVGQIAYIQNGAVTYCYPQGNNQSKLQNILGQEDVSAAAAYARENHRAVICGPVTVPGTGDNLIVIKAVFVKDPEEGIVFWGEAVALIRTPDIYAHTLHVMRTLGYDYSLETTVVPGTEDTVSVATSLGEGERMDSPVSYTCSAGECRWTLSVEPAGGWKTERARMSLLEAVVFGISLMLLTYMLIGMRQKDRELNRMAYQDGLTGLPNRSGFFREAEKRRKKAASERMTAVFIDLDDFKAINDVYGHDAGDQALIRMASWLREEFPDSSCRNLRKDTRKHWKDRQDHSGEDNKSALVCRYGGDEFCVLICGESAESCALAVQKLVAQRQSVDVNGTKLTFTISAGFADSPEQAGELAQLISCADKALYATKMSGKQISRHYSPEMEEIKREQLGFGAKDIAAGVPGALLIYQAEGDERILFANHDLIEMFGCSDFYDFLQYTHSSFRHIVHPDDLDRVEEEIRVQISRQKDTLGSEQKHYDDYTEYRIISRNGEVIPILDMGRLVHDEHYGEIFFVFIYPTDRRTKWLPPRK